MRIVLHGLQGQIQVQDRTFDGTMPAFGSRLSDEEVAALLAYVRSSRGSDAPAVTIGTVRVVREAKPSKASRQMRAIRCKRRGTLRPLRRGHRRRGPR
jgi:hypothetical protein